MTDTKGRIVVIGSGAAGSAAARSLAGSGWDVTVVERAKVGGTCLWHGCIPKKALFNAAHARRDASRSELFGLAPCEASFDWPAVLGWKWHAQETYAGDQEEILEARGIRLVKASARFISASAIEAGGHLLEFDHAVIATGSSTSLPPIPGIELADTSDDALGYQEVPEELLIIGGGFIAMEFAGIYATFGSRVTVISSGPRPLEMVDAEAAAVAVRHLLRLGVEFFSDCRISELSGERGALTLKFTDSTGAERTGEYGHALAATGRHPATDGLGLETAGIETDEHGRVVHDRFQRTTNPAVWMAGDAAGGMMQTPVASYEGRTVAESIDSGTPIAPDCTAVPTTVFTVPPIAQVGMTEEALTAAGVKYRASTTPFEYLAAGIIEDERDGLVKYLFSADDGRLLGAHIAGPTAHDLIYAAAVAIRMGATDSDLQQVLGIHPAYSEALNWAAW